MRRFLLISCCLWGLICNSWSEEGYTVQHYSVDFSQDGVPQRLFWNGTGFTPGQLLLRQDMQQALDYQSAIPNQGMRYVRPHWLLNLVSVRNPGSKQAEYSFDRLFAAFDVMIERGMTPVFEIMGFPQISNAGDVTYDANAQGQQAEDGQWIPDFNQREDYLLWHDFVHTLITALQDRYGEDELKRWFFECTNEPDMPQWFWKQGIPALLNYWDATSEAIKEVNSDYVFGGPGTATILSDVFKAVLAHCDSGSNAITGETGAVLDFISIHGKNLPYDMIGMEQRTIDYINKHHPRFAELPFWNNEADPTWGWRKPFWWRPTPWYAAFVVQSVDLHNRLINDAGVADFRLLVNDNGFLGDWYMRTALTRFADPQDQKRFWLLKKPVHNAMALLAHTGGKRLPLTGAAAERNPTSIIPIRKDSGQIVILIGNMPEFGPVRSDAESEQVITAQQKRAHDRGGREVHIALNNMGLNNPTVTHIRLDHFQANPYAAWQAIGQPDKLGVEDYTLLSKAMEPAIISHRQPLDQDRLRVTMTPSSLSMLVISEAGDHQSSDRDQPAIQTITPYQGQNGERTAFVRWQQAGQGVVAYHLDAAYDGGDYQQITPVPVLDLGYLHVLPENVTDISYRVRMVDL